MAFKISHHTQLLYYVWAKSVDHNLMANATFLVYNLSLSKICSNYYWTIFSLVFDRMTRLSTWFGTLLIQGTICWIIKLWGERSVRLIRDYDPTTRWQRKRRLKSEFTFFQCLSRLFLSIYFIESRRNPLDLHSYMILVSKLTKEK